jgi:hypothetical protein
VRKLTRPTLPQHALRSFVYTTAKSMLSYVTKESPIEPRTSFSVGRDDPDRLFPSPSTHRSRPSLSPALSHVPIISPVPLFRSSPSLSAAAAAAAEARARPVAGGGGGGSPDRVAGYWAGRADADAEPAAARCGDSGGRHGDGQSDCVARGGAPAHALLRRGEQAAAHGKSPEQGPGPSAAETELELAAQTEPAPHASSPPGTPPPAPIGLHWPTPTTPRRTADAGAVRLETLHEADGPDESPDRPPEAQDRAAVDDFEGGGANGAGGAPIPAARRPA